MYEEYHYHPADPASPFHHPQWPPAEPPADDGLPDRWCCLATILSWVVIAVLLSVLCGCLTSCRSTRTVIVTEHDTTTVHVRHDVQYVPDTILVPLPPDRVVITTPDTSSTLRTAVAESHAAIRGGLLYHSLRNLDTPLPVPVQHKVITRDSIIYRSREVPAPYPVDRLVEKPLTRWQRARLQFANTMLVALALAAIVFALKKRAWWLRLFR